jgi:DNA-repair protein XRCC2
MSSSASSGFSFMPDENAAQLMRRTRCVPLPTRVGFLDSALRGGALAAGDVLELYGQSASGKTELVYQILLACIMPAKYNDFEFLGIGAGALVVDLDCRFNLLRFSSMLQERFSEEMQTQQPDFDVGTRDSPDA